MFADFYAEYFPTQKLPKRGTVVCVGPLTYKGQAAVQKDIAIFKAALNGAAVADAFLPVVAPASAVPRHTNEYYKDDEEFLFKLAEALREEYKAIVDAGLMVQIDDAFLPYMYDVAFAADDLEELSQMGGGAHRGAQSRHRGLPEERIRYHICWGSFNTPHVTDVALKDIVDLVLRVKAGAYCIEMGNPRHEHEWRVWESVKLPPGRKLIPGVISHSTNVVEHPELVAERLTRARPAGRTRERLGRHRLRLRANAICAARASFDHVGEARSAGGRCAARLARIVGPEGGVTYRVAQRIASPRGSRVNHASANTAARRRFSAEHRVAAFERNR